MRSDAVDKFATVYSRNKNNMMKTTRCKDDNNVIQILEAHSFASCWKMYEWLDRIHRSRLNRISGYASFRPYLPAVSRGINGPGASYINSTRSCWRIIWNDASWLRTRSPSLSLALALHTRTFRVRACAQISARQRMHGTGGNSSWTARVEIIKPARRADNDFDPINSAFRDLPPLRCHVTMGKELCTGDSSCER